MIEKRVDGGLKVLFCFICGFALFRSVSGSHTRPLFRGSGEWLALLQGLSNPYIVTSTDLNLDKGNVSRVW